MIQKRFNITIKGTDVECLASVPYSNCIRLEYFDKSKVIFETGYKCQHLGVTETPLVFMQTIELSVVSVIEALNKCNIEAISSGKLNYTEIDLQLAERWRAFLRDETDSIRPSVVQLSIF